MATSNSPWEELLRRMLPVGAPLPDEDHLDYSIAVEYEGPSPLSYDVPTIQPLTLDSISVRSCSVVSSSDSSSIPVAAPVSRMPNFSWIVDSGIRSGGSFRVRRVLAEKHRLSSDSRPQMGWRVGDGSSEMEEKNSSLKESEAEEDRFSSFSPEQSPSSVADDAAFDGVRSGTVRKVSRHCKRCGKGYRLKEKEKCLVCDARYCRSCLLKAMGSMPEGRKCLSCIGRPIDEGKRSRLGKSSRLLRSVCSSMELSQILKAEKECKANQLRPEQLVVNGRQLNEIELALLLGSSKPPQKLSPGKYWYDKDSGLWGKEGEKPYRIISSKLSVGGKLRADASNGDTKVYINGREITRIERRALKLGNVHCPRGTHFWLYEDGSYEEEGQNNIKGNIWEKASTRFICYLFSLPVPHTKSHGLHDNTTTLSGSSTPEYIQQEAVHKLLLFGLEGSGTSTIYKQMRLLYGNRFSSEELQNIKFIIQRNIYKYLSILLEGRERFEEDVLHEQYEAELDPEESSPGCNGNNECIYSINQRFKHFSDWLLDIMASGDLDAFFPAATREYAPVLTDLWKASAIQETYKRKAELDLPDAAKYFLDQAAEISNNEYEPSEADFLYAEGLTQTNGVAFVEFSFDERNPISGSYDTSSGFLPSPMKYQLIRLSSKVLHEGFKWLEMFEDARVMIFCVALSDYDQLHSSGTGPVRNKMLENRDVFESLVRHPCFKNTHFVLFLNKYDALEDKINRIPLSSCEWFKDFRPLKPKHSNQTLAQRVYYYVAMKFKQLYFSLSGRKLFVWRTRALESRSVDEAFKYVSEVLKWEEEKDTDIYGLSGDDSFFSNEMVVSPYIRRE